MSPTLRSTLAFGINNAGDFAGTVMESDGVTQNAFLSLGGTITTFAIPDAGRDPGVSGKRFKSERGLLLRCRRGDSHGYLRASDGTLTYPIDPEGSVGNNPLWQQRFQLGGRTIH